jgi:flavodoxin
MGNCCFHDFDKPVREELQRKGFDIVGEFSCRGLDTYRATMLLDGINRGRPNAGDLKQAEDSARKILKTVLSD